MDGQQRVTNMELFFDLVYVFAVTQLTRFLVENLTWQGVLHAVVLLCAVWWAWMYTAWVTNWLHPDVRTVRVVLLGVMLASLVVSATLPRAFAGRGLVFAVDLRGHAAGPDRCSCCSPCGGTPGCCATSSGSPRGCVVSGRAAGWPAGS